MKFLPTSESVLDAFNAMRDDMSSTERAGELVHLRADPTITHLYNQTQMAINAGSDYANHWRYAFILAMLAGWHLRDKLADGEATAKLFGMTEEEMIKITQEIHGLPSSGTV